MSNKLIVSSSPHLHSGARTRKIMLDVIIALLPATVMAVVFFGLNALLLIAVTTATAVLSELLFNVITKKKQTVGDLSAVVTGLLLALTLPASTALWQAIIGAVFAIVVVKCLFGGIGCNFANPAIAARVMMLISFTNNVAGGTNTTFAEKPLQAGATPLAQISGVFSGETVPTLAEMLNGKEGVALPSIIDMLIGNRGGAIGETCAIALLVGFIYLLVKKVISWHTPVVFIVSTFALSFLLGGFNLTASIYHVLGGGLLIGAIFMATDYVTSPITKWGKVIFAFGCALFTVIIRVFGSLPEGVSYAILLMNILSTPIEILTAPKALGAIKAKKGGKE